MEKEEEQDAPLTLLSLPLLLVLHIFSLLPVDCRLRCAEVCRGWRAVLSERSLWARLELTAVSGVRVRQGRGSLNSLLRCAAARAGGGLQSLQVDKNRVTHAALLEVAAANSGALRELLCACTEPPAYSGFPVANIEALVHAAPLLRTFATDLECDAQAARRVLRTEASFGPLRVRRLYASLYGDDEAGVVAFAADVAAHTSLQELALTFARLETGGALDAVVDAALALRLISVSLEQCHFSPASAPALARLLGGNALTTLECLYTDMLDAPAAAVRAAVAVLAPALRANATLTSLSLAGTGIWRDPAAGAALLSALTGHASMRVLYICNDCPEPEHQAAVGASFGALVAANAPALTQLDLCFCDLGDDGMRALFEALPHNTHLRTLDVEQNLLSEAFARDVLLPAVRANTSLRSLYVKEEDGEIASAREAMERVAQREFSD
jgi:hypothetical protein